MGRLSLLFGVLIVVAGCSTPTAPEVSTVPVASASPVIGSGTGTRSNTEGVYAPVGGRRRVYAYGED